MGDDNNDYLNNLKSLVGRWKKTVNDPNYQPTDEENQAEKTYYSQLPAAMVGSIAPIEGDGGILEQELVNKKAMDQTADAALSNSGNTQVPSIGQPASPTITDVAKSQQAASRAVDMADRLRKQQALRKIMNR